MKRSFSSRNDSTVIKYKRRCVNAIRDFPFRCGSVNHPNSNNVYLSDVEENKKECPVNESKHKKVPFSPDLELIEYPDYLALEDDDAESCSGSCSCSGHSADYTPSNPESVRYSDHLVLVDEQLGMKEIIGILGVSEAGAIRFHSSGPKHNVKAIKRRGVTVIRDFPPGCGPINHSNSKIVHLSDVQEEEEEFPDYLQLEPELVGLPDYIPLEDDQDCNFIIMDEACGDLNHLETSEERKVIAVTDEAESSSVASCSWGTFSDHDDYSVFRLTISEEVTSAPPINRLSSTTLLASGCFGCWWN